MQAYIFSLTIASMSTLTIGNIWGEPERAPHYSVTYMAFVCLSAVA